MAAYRRLGAMLGRSSLFWAVLLVAVAGTLVYAPAYLADRATEAPSGFFGRPVDGWRFLAEAVPAMDDARAGDADDAAAIAVREFAGSAVRPVEVGLVFAVDRRVDVGAGQERRMVTAKRPLVWKVTGRTRPGEVLRVVGLIDFRSGELVYDVRTAA
jgi:hypothetical protein